MLPVSDVCLCVARAAVRLAQEDLLGLLIEVWKAGRQRDTAVASNSVRLRFARRVDPREWRVGQDWSPAASGWLRHLEAGGALGLARGGVQTPPGTQVYAERQDRFDPLNRIFAAG